MSKVGTIEPSFLRAGFWRRSAAFFIDSAIMMIPVSLLAGILFAMTDGRLYMTSPFLNYSYCSPLTSYPPTLNPAPPANSNMITSCKIYTLTGMTANTLTVGQRTVNGNLTSTVSMTYELDVRGEPVGSRGADVSWFGAAFVLLLIIPMQALYGRTFGQMALSTRLMLVSSPNSIKIPLRNLLLRYFFAFIFPLLSFIPLLAWFFMPLTPLLAIVALLCFVPFAVWAIGNFSLVVQRKDPWIDRWSGVAEVKKSAPERLVSRPPPLPAMPPPLPHP